MVVVIYALIGVGKAVFVSAVLALGSPSCDLVFRHRPTSYCSTEGSQRARADY